MFLYNTPGAWHTLRQGIGRKQKKGWIQKRQHHIHSHWHGAKQEWKLVSHTKTRLNTCRRGGGLPRKGTAQGGAAPPCTPGQRKASLQKNSRRKIWEAWKGREKDMGTRLG